MNIVYLNITTWSGISIGAEHCYGTLIYIAEAIELTRKLPVEECIKLNKKDTNFGVRYSPGDLTERFNSYDDIRILAIDTFKYHFPDADILVEGGCVADPVRILVAPNDLMINGNALFKEAEDIGWYTHNESRMEEISIMWENLFKDFENGYY